MIIDKCDIVFTNKELIQKVTLPCPDIVVSDKSCTEGTLLGGMCQYEICPEGFTDNGIDCKKETLPAPVICTGVASSTCGRRNNDYPGSSSLTTFFSFIYFETCTNIQINAVTLFPTLQNAYGSHGQSIQFTIGGVVYNEQVDSVEGPTIYLIRDIFAPAYPNSMFQAGQWVKSNTTGQGAGINGSFLSSVTFDGTIWTAPVINNSVTCFPGSILIDGKCYEVTSKIPTQEVPITTISSMKQKALPQTVKVSSGEVKSTISQSHADQLGKDLLNEKINLLQPKCEPIPFYYNTLQTKTGKKTCVTGTPCDITITVGNNQFISSVSQEDADNLAKAEVERLYGLSVPCCIPNDIINYFSDSKNFTFSKACSSEQLNIISPRGGNTVYKTVTIPSFTSTISIKDANQKRDNWFLSNKSLFEKLIICPAPDCEELTIIKTTQKLTLRINGVIWSLERFDTGSFIEDFNELNNEINISTYKIKYCTLVPVYAGTESNITDSTGVNIISIDKNIITYSYIVSSPTFNNGEYDVTIKLQGNTNGANKIFKYGNDNCC